VSWNWDVAWPVIAVIATGAFGLGGVILGRHLQVQDLAKRENERKESERLVACRLIKEELRAAQAALAHAVMHAEWWWEDISTTWWEQHASALASLLTDSEWDVLVKAYHEIAAADRSRRSGHPFTVGKVNLQPGIEAIKAAVATLDRYTGVPDDSLTAGEGSAGRPRARGRTGQATKR
jgi:hypothetical protein